MPRTARRSLQHVGHTTSTVSNVVIASTHHRYSDAKMCAPLSPITAASRCASVGHGVASFRSPQQPKPSVGGAPYLKQYPWRTASAVFFEARITLSKTRHEACVVLAPATFVVTLLLFSVTRT